MLMHKTHTSVICHRDAGADDMHMSMVLVHPQPLPRPHMYTHTGRAPESGERICTIINDDIVKALHPSTPPTVVCPLEQGHSSCPNCSTCLQKAAALSWSLKSQASRMDPQQVNMSKHLPMALKPSIATLPLSATKMESSRIDHVAPTARRPPALTWN